jgi:two-component system probable response regulator PhcQ
MNGHEYKQLSVLFADDEEHACECFRATLEPEFVVYTARSAEEGLDILRRRRSEIGLVVSDQRMPGASGTAFLAKVRHEEPDTVRILTTAYADLDAAIEAVNAGSIYKYIIKPWHLAELRSTLRRAMEYRLLNLERDLQVKEKLASLRHLLVADRVRGLALLAMGLSNHMRNALTALDSYVFLATAEIERQPTRLAGGYEHWRQTCVAESVNGRLLELVENVSQAILDPKYRFDDLVEIETLIEQGRSHARQTAELAIPNILACRIPVKVRCDAPLMVRMFAALLRQIARLGGGRGDLTLEHLGRTTLWGSPAEWMLLRSSADWSSQRVSSLFTPMSNAGDGTSQADADLLTALFIVHHHGGTLDIHSGPPRGPGFELKLPHSPLDVQRPSIEDGLFERLFRHDEGWEQLGSSGPDGRCQGPPQPRRMRT